VKLIAICLGYAGPAGRRQYAVLLLCRLLVPFAPTSCADVVMKPPRQVGKAVTVISSSATSLLKQLTATWLYRPRAQGLEGSWADPAMKRVQ
jgi:hypothetical protein